MSKHFLRGILDFREGFLDAALQLKMLFSRVISGRLKLCILQCMLNYFFDTFEWSGKFGHFLLFFGFKEGIFDADEGWKIANFGSFL